MIAGARLLGRILRVAAVVGLGLLLGFGMRLLAWLPGAERPARQQRWTRWFMRQLSAALPFRVSVHGAPPPQPLLWVSNHVSWTDIALLGSLQPLSFLSKADVRGWPLLGWLAQQAGTLFIRRGAGDSELTRRQMTLRLRQGTPLLMFPEGTTTDGRGLRTFHGRLLASAQDAGVAVQPVAIRYLRDGHADPLAPFIGDDDLLSHLLRLLAADVAEVHIHLLAPIPSLDKPRALLALECQEAIRAALFGEPVAAPDQVDALAA